MHTLIYGPAVARRRGERVPQAAGPKRGQQRQQALRGCPRAGQPLAGSQPWLNPAFAPQFKHKYMFDCLTFASRL